MIRRGRTLVVPAAKRAQRQIIAGLTNEDTDSDSSDLDQRCPVSGDAAWARCWRLAPQMEDMAAGHETGPGESGSTQSCASMLDPRGSEGCAEADCVGGGEEVQAAAGVGGLSRAGSEEEKNAGDSVDMALHELPIRCSADPLPACAARIREAELGIKSAAWSLHAVISKLRPA